MNRHQAVFNLSAFFIAIIFSILPITGSFAQQIEWELEPCITGISEFGTFHKDVGLIVVYNEDLMVGVKNLNDEQIIPIEFIGLSIYDSLNIIEAKTSFGHNSQHIGIILMD